MGKSEKGIFLDIPCKQYPIPYSEGYVITCLKFHYAQTKPSICIKDITTHKNCTLLIDIYLFITPHTTKSYIHKNDCFFMVGFISGGNFYQTTLSGELD